MNKLSGTSADILADNIQKIKQLFPEVFTEEKIDFERLQEVLGEYVEDKVERYRFEWNGKSKALRLAQTQSTGTLRPCKPESKDWPTTENLYIEGDNLEVLKLLQKSYHSKVKMIYIDPPYNTGKDFVYSDNYRDNLQNYLEITGQKDEAGRKISTNSEASGRYHTDWLNMMYPRLRLARNLLRDDGVIFISIDDNEVENLKKICNEIFGEENFEGHIHWRRRHNQPNDKTKMIGIVAEHILAYSKNKSIFKESGVGKIDLSGEFSNPDNDPKGDWATKPWKVGSDQSGSKYSITIPSGKVLNEEWMGDENTYSELLYEGRIVFPRGGDGMPRKKYYRFEREEEGQCATNWWKHNQFGHNQGANDCMTSLFGKKNIFSNPKPVELIRGLVQIANVKNNDIILDFFSGAATTAHATMQFNAEDGGKRKCIMVQLPEPTDKNSEAYKAGYKNICEIGKERIRRAGEKIKEEIENEPPRLDEAPRMVPDIGFKVFKLDSSNLKKWNPDFANLEKTLEDMVDNYVEGRTEEDVLYEIMLKYGIDLTLPMQTETVKGQKVFIIGSGALFICLADKITKDIAEFIIAKKEELQPEVTRVVFKDNGFENDDDKANVEMELERHGFDDVVSV